ncbi:hypothetical protein DESC_780015 [Desulfosarcina cetonica]|nr:hypothetical protein DESC_780015 [Desulfosarcina cetonica]
MVPIGIPNWYRTTRFLPDTWFVSNQTNITIIVHTIPESTLFYNFLL